MSQDNNIPAGAAFWIGAILASILWLVVGMIVTSSENSILRAKAIKNGAAEYDKTTGEWRWKVKVENE